MGEQILDVYHGRKVFSVRWNNVDAIDVVAFKPGDWRQILRASAISPSGWHVDGCPESHVSDRGTHFHAASWVRPHIEKFFNDQMHIGHFVGSTRAPVKN